MTTPASFPQSANWFQLDDPAGVPSPSLLIYRERLEFNLQRMLAIAGDPLRLRPHIKTHKMRELIELQRAQGITKFKCATIAEAELAGLAGVPDLLLAYQPVGPNIGRLLELRRRFPATRFSVVCDDARVVGELSRAMGREGSGPGTNSPASAPLEVLLDLDVGQHRTGLVPSSAAAELYRFVAAAAGLKPGGLHAYDGHIADGDPAARTAACEAAFAPVAAFRAALCEEGLPVARVVAGGTPTLAIHAGRPDVECSPGTCVFWDAGYAVKCSDLGFVPAAVLLTRVVSRPGPTRLCLDLGHKAVGSEMAPPRVQFPQLPDARAVLHSEEHLVVESSQSSGFDVGDCLYAVPWHVCPTVALHAEAVVIAERRVVGCWKVAGRDRRLTI
jgi:D-threonine aldolase